MAGPTPPAPLPLTAAAQMVAVWPRRSCLLVLILQSWLFRLIPSSLSPWLRARTVIKHTKPFHSSYCHRRCLNPPKPPPLALYTHSLPPSLSSTPLFLSCVVSFASAFMASPIQAWSDRPSTLSFFSSALHLSFSVYFSFPHTLMMRARNYMRVW